MTKRERDPSQDLSRPIEVGPGIWWVGTVEDGSPFQCHAYVLDVGSCAVLFEPGSSAFYPKVMQKVIQVVPLPRIRYIVVSHQDPDLCASLPDWKRALPSPVRVVTHSRSWVLVQHYGVHFAPYLVDQENWELSLTPDRSLRFLFTPWCHCPGSFVTYDPETRTLFSGDLFGAITYRWTFQAGNGYKEAMRSFHEDYMASTRHLRAALHKIARLPLDRILPQHGSLILEEPQRYIQALRTLRCGLDLLQDEEDLEGLVSGHGISQEEVLLAGSPAKDERPSSTLQGTAPDPAFWRELIQKVLHRQIGVLGLEDTLSVARSVDGLAVNDQGEVVDFFPDQGETILAQLLEQFEKRFGKWAVLNCRFMLYDSFRRRGVPFPRTLHTVSPTNSP